MIERLKEILSKIMDFFTKEERRKSSQSNIDEVRAALEQWQTAKKYFETANDADVIDYAIYDMECSRRRYSLLIKNAKAAEYDSTREHIDISG